jgi:hypothetical protein
MSKQEAGWLDQWSSDMKDRAKGKATEALRKALRDLRQGGYSGKAGSALETVIVAELEARGEEGGEKR